MELDEAIYAYYCGNVFGVKQLEGVEVVEEERVAKMTGEVLVPNAVALRPPSSSKARTMSAPSVKVDVPQAIATSTVKLGRPRKTVEATSVGGSIAKGKVT